jgi:peptidyl-prolyl cis-trans isomerase SurA
MKKVILSIAIALFGLSATAQNKEKNILTIDNKAVSLEDFIYVYEKNNGKQTDLYSKKSLDESLNLFVNYRLKVSEAENRKLDTTKAFIQELEGYRKQLAKPYMTDDSFLAAMTKEAYDRVKEDVNTSHILFMCDEFASPEDTLKAYAKAIDVRKKILAGQDFGQLAIQYSEDPSAKEPSYPKGYKGYLGYNLAFTFVYPYESAAYKTAVGQVSMPVRSKFGYHIIKVNEKRVNPGEVRTAHIMIDAKDGIDAADSVAQRQLAFDIYKSLKDGGDWNELCTKFSSDGRSAEKGGELQAFQLDGKLRVPAYEQAAFALKNVGDFSLPVKSPYGWHIIKLLEKTPVASFDVLKDELTKKVKSSDRFALNEEVLMKKLKAENNFKESKGVKTKLSIYADSSLVKGTWTTPAKAKTTKKMFTVNKEKVTYGQFYTYLEDNQKNHKQAKSPSLIMSMAYDKFVNQTVYNYAESHLGEKHPEYKMLLKEFRDGILFFELMQKEVWNKASADTTGIKNYYEANKTKYVKPLEFNATVYKAKNLEILNQLIDSVKAGKSETQIKMHFTKESALNLTTETKTFEKGKNEWVDKLASGQKDLKIVENGNFIYVKVYEEIPEGIKPLAKCRGLVIADYQSVVEVQWIEQLKSKYKVVVNQEVVKSLVK